MWQICAFIPQSLEDTEELAELATKLTSAFFLETYIHAKERVYILIFLYLSFCMSHYLFKLYICSLP